MTTRAFTVIPDAVHLLLEAAECVGAGICKVFVVLVVELLRIGM